MSLDTPEEVIETIKQYGSLRSTLLHPLVMGPRCECGHNIGAHRIDLAKGDEFQEGCKPWACGDKNVVCLCLFYKPTNPDRLYIADLPTMYNLPFADRLVGPNCYCGHSLKDHSKYIGAAFWHWCATDGCLCSIYQPVGPNEVRTLKAVKKTNRFQFAAKVLRSPQS